jgi:hypothetical protein
MKLIKSGSSMGNNNIEAFRIYETKIKLPRIPCRDEICDDRDGLRIIIGDKGNTKKYKIIFKCALLYMRTDEGYRLKSMKIPWTHIESCICLVDNSRLLRWFHEESLEIYKDYKIFHYSICTEDDWIDVLSSEEPEIQII